MKEAAPTLVTEELLERRIAAIDTLHIELTRITEELFSRPESRDGALIERRRGVQEMIQVFNGEAAKFRSSIAELKGNLQKNPLIVEHAKRLSYALTRAYNELYSYEETAERMVRVGTQTLSALIKKDGKLN